MKEDKQRVVIAAFSNPERVDEVARNLVNIGFEKPLYSNISIDTDSLSGPMRYDADVAPTLPHDDVYSAGTEQLTSGPSEEFRSVEPDLFANNSFGGLPGEVEVSKNNIVRRAEEIKQLRNPEFGANEHIDTMIVPESIAEGGATGAMFGGTIGLLMGVGGLAFPAVIPAFASGVWIPAAAGLAIGTTLGGIQGWLRGIGISDITIAEYEALIERGFNLITIHCASNAWETKAMDALREFGAEYISVYSEEEAATLTERANHAAHPVHG